MKNILPVFLLTCFVCMGCHSKSGKNKILGIDSMKVVMWDMLRADELYQHILGKDSTAKTRREDIRLYDEVFLIHKITKGNFDNSYKYYESQPPKYKELIDSLDAFSARERAKGFKFAPVH